MTGIINPSWDGALASLNPAMVFSQAEMDTRPDRTWNPWRCNHRGLMANVDAGGMHAVSWASNNQANRDRLGKCIGCNSTIFIRSDQNAPLVEGHSRQQKKKSRRTKNANSG